MTAVFVVEEGVEAVDVVTNFGVEVREPSSEVRPSSGSSAISLSSEGPMSESSSG